MLIKSVYFILSPKADSAPTVDVGGLRNQPPPPREVWPSTDSRRRRANAVLSSKIIIFIHPTDFKTSALAAADDDDGDGDDEEEDFDRAMMGTSNKQADNSIFFKYIINSQIVV